MTPFPAPDAPGRRRRRDRGHGAASVTPVGLAAAGRVGVGPVEVAPAGPESTGSGPATPTSVESGTVSATDAPGTSGRQSSATASPDVPRLVRPTDRRLVAGVAAGIAVHLNVSVSVVRAVFVVLAFLAGAGVLGYALLWIFVPQAEVGAAEASAGRRTTSTERRQALGIAALGIAVGIVAMVLGAGQWAGMLAGPLIIVAIGTAFIWREADDAQRGRWRRTATEWARPRRGAWWRIAAGVVLVVVGLAVFAAAQVDVSSARTAVIAVVLTLVGVAVIAIPWLTKLLRDLTDERRERIRETEKAEVAAHLHDSVLQTLALIQRQPGDAREVQRLARAQERDLRAWLYGPGGYARRGGAGLAADDAGRGEPRKKLGGDPGSIGGASGHGDERAAATCAEALAMAAAHVEDTYAVTISPVVVGDSPLTEPAAALMAAAREAMVNAAKHAGVDTVSVYAEFEANQASVFVRDRGRGFDPSAVARDRRGVAESIRGRMERYGGHADLKSKPGGGTEWALRMVVS